MLQRIPAKKIPNVGGEESVLRLKKAVGSPKKAAATKAAARKAPGVDDDAPPPVSTPLPKKLFAKPAFAKEALLATPLKTPPSLVLKKTPLLASGSLLKKAVPAVKSPFKAPPVKSTSVAELVRKAEIASKSRADGPPALPKKKALLLKHAAPSPPHPPVEEQSQPAAEPEDADGPADDAPPEPLADTTTEEPVPPVADPSALSEREEGAATEPPPTSSETPPSPSTPPAPAAAPEDTAAAPEFAEDLRQTSDPAVFESDAGPAELLDAQTPVPVQPPPPAAEQPLDEAEEPTAQADKPQQQKEEQEEEQQEKASADSLPHAPEAPAPPFATQEAPDAESKTAETTDVAPTQEPLAVNVAGSRDIESHALPEADVCGSSSLPAAQKSPIEPSLPPREATNEDVENSVGKAPSGASEVANANPEIEVAPKTTADEASPEPSTTAAEKGRSHDDGIVQSEAEQPTGALDPSKSGEPVPNSNLVPTPAAAGDLPATTTVPEPAAAAESVPSTEGAPEPTETDKSIPSLAIAPKDAEAAGTDSTLTASLNRAEAAESLPLSLTAPEPADTAGSDFPSATAPQSPKAADSALAESVPTSAAVPKEADTAPAVGKSEVVVPPLPVETKDQSGSTSATPVANETNDSKAEPAAGEKSPAPPKAEDPSLTNVQSSDASAIAEQPATTPEPLPVTNEETRRSDDVGATAEPEKELTEVSETPVISATETLDVAPFKLAEGPVLKESGQPAGDSGRTSQLSTEMPMTESVPTLSPGTAVAYRDASPQSLSSAADEPSSLAELLRPVSGASSPTPPTPKVSEQAIEEESSQHEGLRPGYHVKSDSADSSSVEAHEEQGGSIGSEEAVDKSLEVEIVESEHAVSSEEGTRHGNSRQSASRALESGSEGGEEVDIVEIDERPLSPDLAASANNLETPLNEHVPEGTPAPESTAAGDQSTGAAAAEQQSLIGPQVSDPSEFQTPEMSKADLVIQPPDTHSTHSVVSTSRSERTEKNRSSGLQHDPLPPLNIEHIRPLAQLEVESPPLQLDKTTQKAASATGADRSSIRDIEVERPATMMTTRDGISWLTDSANHSIAVVVDVARRSFSSLTRNVNPVHRASGECVPMSAKYPEPMVSRPVSVNLPSVSFAETVTHPNLAHHVVVASVPAAEEPPVAYPVMPAVVEMTRYQEQPMVSVNPPLYHEEPAALLLTQCPTYSGYEIPQPPTAVTAEGVQGSQMLLSADSRGEQLLVTNPAHATAYIATPVPQEESEYPLQTFETDQDQPGVQVIRTLQQVYVPAAKPESQLLDYSALPLVTHVPQVYPPASSTPALMPVPLNQTNLTQVVNSAMMVSSPPSAPVEQPSPITRITSREFLTSASPGRDVVTEEPAVLGEPRYQIFTESSRSPSHQQPVSAPTAARGPAPVSHFRYPVVEQAAQVQLPVSWTSSPTTVVTTTQTRPHTEEMVSRPAEFTQMYEQPRRPLSFSAQSSGVTRHVEPQPSHVSEVAEPSAGATSVIGSVPKVHTTFNAPVSAITGSTIRLVRQPSGTLTTASQLVSRTQMTRPASFDHVSSAVKLTGGNTTQALFVDDATMSKSRVVVARPEEHVSRPISGDKVAVNVEASAAPVYRQPAPTFQVSSSRVGNVSLAAPAAEPTSRTQPLGYPISVTAVREERAERTRLESPPALRPASTTLLAHSEGALQLRKTASLKLMPMAMNLSSETTQSASVKTESMPTAATTTTVARGMRSLNSASTATRRCGSAQSGLRHRKLNAAEFFNSPAPLKREFTISPLYLYWKEQQRLLKAPVC